MFLKSFWLDFFFNSLKLIVANKKNFEKYLLSFNLKQFLNDQINKFEDNLTLLVLCRGVLVQHKFLVTQNVFVNFRLYTNSSTNTQFMLT